MSPYRRNVAVGLTVLVAGLILAWMILQFGGSLAQPFTQKQFSVNFVSERADGLSDGSPISYRGVVVGRVGTVKQRDDMVTIDIQGLINQQPPLPSNVSARIRTQGLIGGGAGIALEVHEGQQPQGRLEDGAQVQTRYVGLDIIPPEFSELATEWRLVSKQFRESGVIENLNQQVTKVGGVLDSAESLLNDPKLREDLKTSLANLREVTDSAKRISGNLEKASGEMTQLTSDARGAISDARTAIEKTEGHVDNIAAQVEARMGQVSGLLEQFQTIAAKVDRGDGTVGKMVNDPRLYESLVATTEQLTLAIKDLKRLVEQWEQEGVRLKLR